MRIPWNTGNKPKLLIADIATRSPRNLAISVGDWYKPGTLYSYQEAVVNGPDSFEISCPITPARAFFEIKDLDNPMVDTTSFLDLTLTEKPFEPKWNCNFNSDPLLQEFLRFASWFAENKNILSSAYGDMDGSIYKSINNNFTIKYVPAIIDDDEYTMNEVGDIVPNPNYGGISPTSFRIDSDTNVMEASQYYVVDYTVPQVIVLLSHEFSHGWVNRNPANENEADYHALNICRCLGFGKREIGDGLLKVFERYPSDENGARCKRLMSQLENMP